jgi:hypothetical protein
MIAVTVALVYYARVTILEGKKNRRKATIEKQLENVHSPLFEILGRPMHIADSTYYYSPDDLRKIWGIVQSFGYYLDSDEHAQFRRLLRVGTPDSEGFRKDDVEACKILIQKRLEKLKQELNSI